MRLSAEPIFLSELSLDRMTRLDQLTVVRNHVRQFISSHAKDARGDELKIVEVEVGWLDGDVETLAFDLMVGFPIEPSGIKWYAKWRKETLQGEP